MRKSVYLEGLQEPVIIARRKGTRSVRLAIGSDGSIRLTIPYGVSENAAVRFASNKIDWIKAHAKQRDMLTSGMHIGKSHTLIVENAPITRPSTKVSKLEVRVRLPLDVDATSHKAQMTIRKACNKALLTEAETLLPQRLQQMSVKHGIPYTSIRIQKLKSRWGACDSHNNISLNSYLIQLDWQLIDYVICHELAHTVHHNHSSKFWEVVANMMPDFKEVRRELKSKPTDVITT